MSDLTINVSENTIQSGTGGIKLDPAATEIVTINQGVLLPDGTESQPAIRFADDDNTGIFSPDNDVIATTAHGKTSLKVTGVISGENYLTITNAQVNGTPTLSVEGPDLDIDLTLSAQGDGDIRVTANEMRVQTNSPGGILINGFSVLKDVDNISRLTNDVGYLTTVTANDVGLGNVDNTSDLNKPVSTATQTALDSKAETVHTHVEADILDLDKYTQLEVDNALTGKANSVHTHVKADITDFSDLDYATALQGTTADSALQPGDNISELVNDAGYITSAGASAINDLTDVTITTPSTDQVLTYNGAIWVNQDAPAGSGGGAVYKEREFTSLIVDQFAKGYSQPFPSIETERGSLPTTAHCPTNNIIVNVFNRSTQDSQHTLTFFEVDKAAGTRTVLSSETTTLSGTACKWVDISETGDRVAVAMYNNVGNDFVTILVTTDDWVTFAVEQTIDVAPSSAETVTSVALNGDGSTFVVGLGNSGSSGTAIPGVRKFTRTGSTWSFGEEVFQHTTGSSDSVVLMYGQQDDTTAGFMICANGSGVASYHLYLKSGTWSQVWTSVTVDREKWSIPCISFDGDTILYKPAGSGSTVVVNAKTSPTEFGTPEGQSSNHPYCMTGDGYNFSITSSGTVTWLLHRDGTSLPEIGFQHTSLNYAETGTYSSGGNNETSIRPSKGNTHYYFQGAPFLVKSQDALISCIDHANWVNPGSGIKYV